MEEISETFVPATQAEWVVGASSESERAGYADSSTRAGKLHKRHQYQCVPVTNNCNHCRHENKFADNLTTHWKYSNTIYIVLHKNIAMMTNRHSVPGLLVLDDIKGNFGPWGAFYFRKPDSSKMSGKLKASKTTPQKSLIGNDSLHLTRLPGL